MRAPILVCLALSVAACSPRIPDSGAGVGFEEYDSYNAQPIPSPIQTAPAPVAGSTGFSTDGAAAAIDRATGAPLAGTSYPAGYQPVAPVQPTYAQPLNPIPQPVAGTSGDAPGLSSSVPAGIKVETGETEHYSSGGISDEQDFSAVSARETIESDKARIERNRAQYQVDQPGALPERSGGDQTSIVIRYALYVTHPVGTQMYNRSGLSLTNSEKACAKYSSADQAQEAFLNAGGPERDRRGLDPDGDGYACDWDPAPFRAALQ